MRRSISETGQTKTIKNNNTALKKGNNFKRNSTSSSSSLLSEPNSDQPDLRLTPTTLRRVIQQRDHFEEENKKLIKENNELKIKLEEHLKCENIINELNNKINKQNNDILEFEKNMVILNELKEEYNNLELSYKTSLEMNKRNSNKSNQIEILENKLKEISDKYLLLNENKNELVIKNEKLLLKQNEQSSSSSITPEDFYKAIENFKLDSLMQCISERIFVHVVAPRTILQIGGNNPNNNNKKEYKPNIPSDEKINNFIKKEIEPHFQMVFKTLDSDTSSSTSTSSDHHHHHPNKPNVEEQVSPDGTTIKTYAEKFNLSLSSFIKKCIQDS
jgi:hypothetical protein